MKVKSERWNYVPQNIFKLLVEVRRVFENFGKIFKIIVENKTFFLVNFQFIVKGCPNSVIQSI